MKKEYNHWLPKLLRVNGIVLFQTIYFAQPRALVTDGLENHEKAHVRQQKRDGNFTFLAKYLIGFLRNFLQCWSFRKAYLDIPYEKEAREEALKKGE